MKGLCYLTAVALLICLPATADHLFAQQPAPAQEPHVQTPSPQDNDHDQPSDVKNGVNCTSTGAPEACAALQEVAGQAGFSCSGKTSKNNASGTSCHDAIAAYRQLIDAANAASDDLQQTAQDPSQAKSMTEKTAKQSEAQVWANLACELSANFEAYKAGNYKVPTAVPPTSPQSSCYQSSPYFRGLIGGMYSAASATDPQFKLLTDLTVDLPIGADKRPNGQLNSQSFWLWGYTRIGSVSQQNSVIDPSQIAADYAKLSNAQPSQIVQSFEMNAGAAYRVGSWRSNMTYFDRGSFSLIAGGGALTPLSPSQIAPQTFSGLQSSLVNLYPSLTPGSGSCDSSTVGTKQLCYVSYYPQDRSRFYSFYEAGLRVKLYPSNEYRKASPFPAMFDVTLGQNEYVTGGRFDGAVLHFGGSTPISAVPGLYVFGNMDVGIHNRADQAINAILTPYSTTLPSTVSAALQVIQPPPNRDRYALGFGIDILQLLRTHQLQDAFNSKSKP
jgi:hypothetical protein